MTGQFSDTIVYKDEPYVLVGRNGDSLPAPRDFNINPYAWSTGSARGYINEYCIADNRLHLKSMVLGSKDKSLPQIDSVKPVVVSKNKKNLHQTIVFVIPKFLPPDSALDITSGLCHYPNVMVPLQFSGRLFLGQQFIDNHYAHCGYQLVYDYVKLLEITFVHGGMMEQRDLSNQMQRFRDTFDRKLMNYFALQRENLKEYGFDEIAPF